MAATYANASTVRDHIRDAFKHLQAAEAALQVALNHAAVDYAHNDDRLRNIHGGLRLLTSAVASEDSLWTDYARARSNTS